MVYTDIRNQEAPVKEPYQRLAGGALLCNCVYLVIPILHPQKSNLQIK